MRKICINPKNYKLTQNKEYLIIEEDGDYYRLVNDNGRTVRYDQSLFNDVVEEIPVIPPPPPARTEQDCINSITINGETVSFVDMNNNIVSFNIQLQVTDSAISCGVYEMYRISDLMSAILNRVNQDEQDLPELIKELFIRSIRYKVENSSDHRYMLLSTNYNDVYEDFYTHLNELSNFSSEWKENPNSGNNIKVWGLDIH